MKLSPVQLATLRMMQRDKEGVDECPKGYSRAGGDASRWHRTMSVLQRLGLVRPRGPHDWKAYELTDLGRSF